MKMKLFISILLISCINILSQNEEVKLGAKLTLNEKTKISDILADPDAYLDQTV